MGPLKLKLDERWREDAVASEQLLAGHFQCVARLSGMKSTDDLQLQHFQAKWTPVRVKKMRQYKDLEPRSDSIGTEKALGQNAHLPRRLRTPKRR